MDTLASLQQRFATSARFLSFDEANGLVRAHLDTPDATATIYLQGAHLTEWQPAGQQPVLYLSRRSDFAPGKPIRGGIPVVFPWFANDSKPDRIDGHPGPSHGFARISPWTLSKVEQHGHDVTLTLTLDPNDMSRSMGFDRFHLSISFVIGRTLSISLTVENTGGKPLAFEEAFHSYYRITDIHEATVSGLEPTPFIDKTDDFKVKPAAGAPLSFSRKVDSVYLDTTATCTITDHTIKRRITVEKRNSHSTIVFNPWAEMPDLGAWEWHDLVAVETANVARNGITLAPGEKHTMSAMISVANL